MQIDVNDFTNCKLITYGISSQHMSYEIDRQEDKEPSLREMSEKALNILRQATEGSDQGFFLMIEGSRIDMAAHS
jgi:alkaline phosphatase